MKRKICFPLFALFLISNLAMAQKPSTPIIDAHCHLRTLPDELFQSMEEYFEENESVNLKYVFGLTVAQKGDMEKTRLQNDSLFAMAKRDARLIPVCSVHPYDGELAREELKRIKELGGRIIKLHPLRQNFESAIKSDDVILLTRAAGDLGLIVLVDGYGYMVTDYLDNLLQLAILSPDTKFIIAHMGGADFYKLGGFKMVQDVNRKLNPNEKPTLSNVWYDISATVVIYEGSPYQSHLEWVISNTGADRFLFGSDAPAVTLSETLDAFNKLNLTESEKEQILFTNAKELLGLE